MDFASLSLGQYVPTGSPIHRLDPRAKLVSLLCLVSWAFAADGLVSSACRVAVLAALVALARLSWRAVLRSMRPMFFLAAFALIFNAVSLLWDGGTILRAVSRGSLVALRLLILMGFAVLLPLTTAPLELADGIEALLRPLSRLGFPAHECGMMAGMALRFIPLLMEETDRVVRAQLSRGARLDQGGPIRRLLAFIPVLIPLFVIIFRRADDMALAMEARGYRGGEGRTRMRPLEWKRADGLAVSLCAVVLAASLVMRAM